MAFLKEFKEFALKGNVMDMAVGVIIGGAFGKIVSSLVNDILMPPIGALIGNTDFSQLRLDISKFRDMTSSAVHAVGDVVTGGREGGCRTRLLELRRLHPAVHRLYDPGILRLPDGQADEPADAEKGRGRRSGACARTRTHEGGVAAGGDPRPAQGAEKIVPQTGVKGCLHGADSLLCIRWERFPQDRGIRRPGRAVLLVGFLFVRVFL